MILEKIYDMNEWNNFLNVVKEDPMEDRLLIKNIEAIIKSNKVSLMSFPIPEKIVLKKYQDSKERIVYSYGEPYNTYLKFINYKLQEDSYYRNKFSKDSIAYQRNKSISYSIKDLHNYMKRNKNKSYLKLDYKNFFNSINTNIMSMMNYAFLDRDINLAHLMNTLIEEPKVIYEGKIIEEHDKGVMAGTPLAGYMSNIYMNELDKSITSDSSLYYKRYADDLIIIHNTSDYDKVRAMIEKRSYVLGIKLNDKKEAKGLLKDGFDFLGFHLDLYNIDINESGMNKMKKRIKRRGLWFRKNTSIKYKHPKYEIAAATFIKGMNKKLFTRDSEDGTCWIEWYGKSLTTDKSLQIIEDYYKQYIRYILSGKHKGYKKSSEIKYSALKKLGYRSLINEYWKGKKVYEKNKRKFYEEL